MKYLVTALLATLLLSGCTTFDDGTIRMTARGESEASEVRCEMLTIHPDGTRECSNSIERRAEGGKGSMEIYELIGTVAGFVFSGVSILLQALR